MRDENIVCRAGSVPMLRFTETFKYLVEEAEVCPHPTSRFVGLKKGQDVGIAGRTWKHVAFQCDDPFLTGMARPVV